MALRTVSIQQSPSLAEVVDKGLEEIQEKNNVGQKLHKTPPFIDGWIKTRLGARIFNKSANRRRLSVAAQAAVWIIVSEADENKNADCFSAIGIGQ
jgi:hypothetical protein